MRALRTFFTTPTGTSTLLASLLKSAAHRPTPSSAIRAAPYRPAAMPGWSISCCAPSHSNKGYTKAVQKPGGTGNWKLCEYLRALAKFGRLYSCHCVRSCQRLLLICRSRPGVSAEHCLLTDANPAYLMSHVHSIAGFSGRSAPDARCTAEGGFGVTPIGGLWSVRTVQQHHIRQKCIRHDRATLRYKGAQCAAAVAGISFMRLSHDTLY